MKSKLRDITGVLSEAISLCEPTPAESRKLAAAAEKCKVLVEAAVSGNPDIVEVVFGGSFAKGTWLRGDADVDIFMKIRSSLEMSKFEALGKNLGLSAMAKYRPKLRYSDHPYVEAFVDKIRVNIVPCYDVEQGNWQSAADRSPYHTDYIKKNFGSEEKVQTLLLKRFLKSAGIYGAEISVGGFSGYVCEVLIMRYRSFEAVLRAASDWTHRQVIAIADQFDPDIVKGFISPIVIIDPVDSRRNLGTAISAESVGKLILAARSFIDAPSMRFFQEDRRAASRARNLCSNIVIVEFRHRERSPDVIWGQLKRSLAAIAKQLELADFEVLRSSCVSDEKDRAAMAFLLSSPILPAFAKRKGPEVFRRNDCASYLRNPKNRPHMAWVDSELRVAMLVDRKVTDAKVHIKSLFGDRLENSGISKDLLAERSMLRIYSGRGGKMGGVAKEAVGEIVSTEHFILGRA